MCKSNQRYLLIQTRRKVLEQANEILQKDNELDQLQVSQSLKKKIIMQDSHAWTFNDLP